MSLRRVGVSKAAGWTAIRSSEPRTTFTYVAVAVAGSDDQKAAFRRAVNKVRVYSTPERARCPTTRSIPEHSCGWRNLYKGGVDIYRTFVGGMDDEEADHHYRAGMAMGTTLQVPPQCGHRIGRPSTATGLSLDRVHR